MKRRIRSIVAAPALLAIVVSASEARATMDVISTTMDVISTQITELASAVGVYRTTHRLSRGWLDEGETRSVTYRLAGGVGHTLIGACDVDCSDLDFDLYDASGERVASDHASDDTPIVSVRPPYTQTYRLRVKMYSCRIEPCEFGIGAYRN